MYDQCWSWPLSWSLHHERPDDQHTDRHHEHHLLQGLAERWERMEIWENSISGEFHTIAEWKEYLSFHQAEFIPPRASFPTILCVFYGIVEYLYLLKNKKCTWTCFRSPDSGKKDNSIQEQTKYFELLNELIQRRKKMEDKTDQKKWRIRQGTRYKLQDLNSGWFFKGTLL